MSKYEPVKDKVADLDRDAALEARIRARAEIDRLNAIADDEITDEETALLEAALDDVDAIDARVGEIDAAAAERADRIAAARERAGKVADPADEAPAEDPAPVEPVAEAEVEAEPEVVVASGTKRPVARAASKQAPAVILNKDPEPKHVSSIIASANIPGFTAGEGITDMARLAEAFLGRVDQFGGKNPKDMKAGVYEMSPRATKFGVAQIKREEREFAVDREMSLEKQMSIIQEAAQEKNLSGGSVIAAGGWCAPSETIYELFSYATTEGLIDLPEVTARRGGIQFTKGPDFMTVFGDPDSGFIQTETQAEAGTVKPCYALECPPFEEVRLDAIGFCATAPLLTEAAYPELVRQVLDMLVMGHARRKSQSTINRIIAQIATNPAAIGAVTFAPVGAAGSQSGLADSLAAAELRANQIRQSLAMSPTATIEGMLPYWARGVFRTELSRRLGLDSPFMVADSDVDQFFALRGIRFQYLYDLQMLNSGAAGTVGGTAGWTAWPTTLDFYMWPAGAFTRLVNDVVNLSAVYDHDLLTQNEYTAAFVEEGIAVANTRGFGLKTTVALNPEGSAGFPAIGAGAGITIPAA